MSTDPADEFEAVCLPFLKDCYAFALALTRRPADAEDLVQDTFLKAQRAFGSFRTGTNAKAWLFTILKRLHIDRYRRARLRPIPLPADELVEMAPSPPEADEAPAWTEISSVWVQTALEQVPEPFRLPVRLRDLDGLSYREIGEILDVPPGTVMSRLFRGREYLRRGLVALMRPSPSPSPPPGSP